MRSLLLLLLAATSVALTGCESPRPGSSTQPHSQPASWEGGMPGMGGMGMGTGNR